MSTEHSIPPLRDLPPGHLGRRKLHLLAEIARETRPRLSLRTFALPRPRVVALAAASLCAVLVAAVLGITMTGGSGTSSRPLFVVQAVHSPAWGAETAGINWGGLGLACSNASEVLLGCNGPVTAPSRPESHPLVMPSSAASADTEIVGGSDSQRMLLRSIIDATRPNTIEKITIGVQSTDFVTLQMQANDSSIRTLWQEGLVASAFRDRAKAARTETTVALENGDSSGVIAPGPANPLPSAKQGDVARARQTFEAAAATTGVTLDELNTYQPDGVAVSATLKTDDAAGFLAHKMPTFLAEIGDRWHDYDGVYIRLIDSSDSTVWETSTIARTSSGSVGSRDDLAGCGPIGSWGPTPPPCPAN